MRPHLYKRGGTWYCERDGQWSYADTPSVAFWNFVYVFGLR